MLLLLCGQLDDVLRVAVPDGLRGVSNPSLQTIPLVPSLSMAKHGEGWGFSLESVNLAMGA